MWDGSLRKKIRTLDVEGVGAVEVLLGGAHEVLHGEDAGVGNDNINFSELGDGLLDYVLDAGERARVGLDGEMFGGAAEFFDECVGGGGVRRVVDGDMGAGGGEELSCCSADTLVYVSDLLTGRRKDMECSREALTLLPPVIRATLPWRG